MAHDSAGEIDGSRGLSSANDVDPLRELVVQAGLELLDTHGLSLMYESIGYTKVFRYLEEQHSVRVTRGSVHERIWASQDEFRRDVLVESIGSFPANRLGQTLLDRATKADDPEVFARQIGTRAYARIMDSLTFGQFQSIKALSSRFDDSLTTSVIQKLLNERQELMLTKNRSSFPALLAELQLRPKNALGLTEDQASDLLSILIVSLTEGGNLSFHAGAADIATPVAFRSKPSDPEDEWRIVSIGIISFIDFLFEPAEQEPTGATEPPSEPTPIPSEDPDPQAELPTSFRRPREQLRELVLTAGVDLLLQNGLDLKPELLGYKNVFDHIEKTRGRTVHRASVHGRFWASNDEFRSEVLAKSLEIASQDLRPSSETMRRVDPILSADGSADLQLTKNIRIRIAADSLTATTPGSVARRRLLQIKAVLIDGSQSATKTQLRIAVGQIDEERVRRHRTEVKDGLVDLGYRVRPDSGLSEDEALHIVAVLAMTTAAGITSNSLAGVGSFTASISIPDSDLGGHVEDWTPAGIAMRAYFDQVFEEDVSA